MKLYDYMKLTTCDIDVWDTEIDMGVAFVFDPNETPTDNYDKFLRAIALNTEVTHVGKYGLTVDFSGWLKNYNKELLDLDWWYDDEFSGDEYYYNAVLWMESAIAGFYGDKKYGKFLSALKLDN